MNPGRVGLRATGAVSLLGWVATLLWLVGLGNLTAVAGVVSMKFTTAVLFGMVSAALWNADSSVADVERREGVATALLVSVLAGVSFLTWAKAADMDVVFHALAFNDAGDNSTVPGAPSVGTMAAFMVLCWCAASRLLHYRLAAAIAGLVVAFAGAVAVAGHILGQPALYFQGPGSTAMNVLTALLFMVLGASEAVRFRSW